MSELSRCFFTEGSIALPEGYRDQSINVLLSDDEFAPSLNISRDVIPSDETLSDYLSRQLDALAPNIQGWVLKAREPAVLGEGAVPGECMLMSYLLDGVRIWQYQAVFALASGRILVFTLSMARELTCEDNVLLQQVLSSYRTA
ncbi:DUF1795 domain-containing protein [Serratia marcescens]|uniref:DUF1795 domain-containing protein n=1 Tax=Serratia marcescens TaxID=615 RepID=A0ABX5NIN1_SERMA|nr:MULTISPECIES: DUF1795 domain-containing protein [Serratia]MDI9110331.1 DUF1795 domain-containing protein [Serratia marcescens]MDR8536430.1 DUF1795 domain-containing protein [Serratia nevei]PXZ92264.1 DUF1795 domain-containing protein [Serratia marcescens]PYA12873.1 DUF1795 domain-containing protein [Serratia marcescens]PYA20867.1 DUF1795 domain-containing protein [Serratia marcescens]